MIDQTFQARAEDLHSETIESTLLAPNTTYSVTKQMPDVGYRVIAVRVEVYDDEGAVIPTVEGRGRINVSMKTKTSPKILYFNEGLDVFTLHELEKDNQMWIGWQFVGRAETEWQFSFSVINSKPVYATGGVIVRIHLIGYLNPYSGQ